MSTLNAIWLLENRLQQVGPSFTCQSENLVKKWNKAPDFESLQGGGPGVISHTGRQGDDGAG